MERFEEFAFFSGFITCSMTLLLDRQMESRQKFFLLILAQCPICLLSLELHFDLSNLYVDFETCIYLTLTVPNFALWICPLCLSLGNSSLILTFIMLFLMGILYPNTMRLTLTMAKISINPTSVAQ